jgi:mannosyltransferase OCH1-like enzyme
MIQLGNKRLQQQQEIKKAQDEFIKQKKEAIQKHNEEVRIMNQYNQLNIPFVLKDHYDSIIPLNLYTSWHTKNLPPLMRQNYEILKKENPEFNHFLYDEEECRNFIQENFDASVLNAYNNLIPCAYKADLWRYCVLYIKGGIYIDIKFQCANGFKLIALTEKEYFVRDIPNHYIYNALIVTLPKNKILLNTINQLVKNVKNKYYGINCLCPTGPALLGSFLTLEQVNRLELYHQYTVIENKMADYYLVYNDQIILRSYNKYREEQSQNKKHDHYGEMWNGKNIYYG